MRYKEGLGLLPEHMRGGMERWITHGISPGSFLEAILSNDLAGAVSTADAVNIGLLGLYVQYLHHYAPAACWGSVANCEAWAAHHGAEGLDNGVA